MAAVDPRSIDFATLAWLAGASANELLLQRVRAAGHPRIRNAHGYVFQHLIQGSPTVGELSELMGFTQQAASKVVAELEGLGYVERRDEAGDRRIRRVHLTRKGIAVVESARAARAALEGELASKLGKKRLNEAREALVALLELSGGLSAVSTRRALPPSE